LSIVKVADDAAPKVGENVVFTLTAANAGPSDATGVVVTDALPTGYTYVSDNGGTATSESAGTVTWTIGSLSDGSNAALEITATVLATGDYENSASITGDQDDPGPGPNTDEPDVPVVPIPQADLSITKTNGQTTYVPGTDVDYTITVTNNGPSAAANVLVVDNLPTGTTGSWTSTNGGSGTGDLSDTNASIANGATVTYTVTVSVPSSFTGNLENTVTVTSDTEDPTPTCTTCTDTDGPSGSSD
ncbi:MAG: DUF11 domain-containing protein, partial [Bacteroidia bacterium]